MEWLVEGGSWDGCRNCYNSIVVVHKNYRTTVVVNLMRTRLTEKQSAAQAEKERQQIALLAATFDLGNNSSDDQEEDLSSKGLCILIFLSDIGCQSTPKEISYYV